MQFAVTHSQKTCVAMYSDPYPKFIVKLPTQTVSVRLHIWKEY